jgi:translation initiation factor 1 (eIF-1/SUI1)
VGDSDRSARKRTRIPLGDLHGEQFRQPLPGLGALRDRLQAETPPTSAEPTTQDAVARTVYGRVPHLVVRRERKGHGGKTWTRIEGLVGSTVEIEAALREMKRALGCGAARDGADVVVQGSQGERIVAFLDARGARKVVVGS